MPQTQFDSAFAIGPLVKMLMFERVLVHVCGSAARTNQKLKNVSSRWKMGEKVPQTDVGVNARGNRAFKSQLTVKNLEQNPAAWGQLGRDRTGSWETSGGGGERRGKQRGSYMHRPKSYMHACRTLTSKQVNNDDYMTDERLIMNKSEDSTDQTVLLHQVEFQEHC